MPDGDAFHRSMTQPWRSRRAEAGQNSMHRGKESQYRSASSASSSIANGSPMRQARLKPAPAETIQNNGTGATSSIPLALLSSPSRGIEVDGKGDVQSSPNLTQPETQSRFRAHISERIQQHIVKYGKVSNSSSEADDLFPTPLPPSSLQSSATSSSTAEQKARQHAEQSGCARPLIDNRAALESLQEVLLLVRRLREGCVAAGRTDVFTMDVYILSVLLSILVGDSIQLSASLGRLVTLLSANEVDYEQESGNSTAGIRAEDEMANLVNVNSPVLDLAHVASLQLLLLTCTGGHTERIGGHLDKVKPGIGASHAWLKQHLSLTQGHRHQHLGENRHIQMAVKTHVAITRHRPLLLRAILLDDTLTIWQRALIVRNVPEMRSRVWTTLSRAYMHLSVDSTLLGQESSSIPADTTIERLLFIDTDLVAASTSSRQQAEPRSHSPGAQTQPVSQPTIPDSWDDSVDEESSLRDADDQTIPQRASRLRDCFVLYGLPEVTHSTVQDNGADLSDSLQPWQGRVVVQAGRRVLKLR